MKFVRALAVGALAASFAAGCSDSAGPDGDVTIGDLAGTWTATAFTYTNQADPSQSVELVGLAGLELTITVTSDGSFSGTLMECALPTLCPEQTAAGTMAISGSTMTLTFTTPADFDEPISGTFTLTTGDPDVLRMNATSGVDFDFSPFGGDPGEVPVNLTLVMER